MDDDFFNSIMGDDFFLDSNELTEENQLTHSDHVKLQIISKMREYLNLVEENVRLHEETDEIFNFKVLARYISGFNQVNEIYFDEETSEVMKEEALKNLEDTIMNFDPLKEDMISDDQKLISSEELIDSIVGSDDEKDNDDSSETDW